MPNDDDKIDEDKMLAQLAVWKLHFAAQDGDLAGVEGLLCHGYDVNRFDEIGKTPLHYAVEAGHLDVVERLLQAGGNVNAHDERVVGDTPLGHSAGSCSFEMARRLIEAGADPTIPGWMQLNAIHRAEERKDADANKIQKLLREAAERAKFRP